MAKAPMSHWRQDARDVIAQTLATLPPDATREQKRKALSENYPFGEREHWPYRIWREEVLASIGQEKPAVDRVQFIRYPNAPNGGVLTVSCTWCGAVPARWDQLPPMLFPGRGCLVCEPARQELAGRDGWLQHFGTWLDRMKAEPDDLGLAMIFADLLDEHGFHVMAENYRRYAVVAGKRMEAAV